MKVIILLAGTVNSPDATCRKLGWVVSVVSGRLTETNNFGGRGFIAARFDTDDWTSRAPKVSADGVEFLMRERPFVFERRCARDIQNICARGDQPSRSKRSFVGYKDDFEPTGLDWLLVWRRYC